MTKFTSVLVIAIALLFASPRAEAEEFSTQERGQWETLELNGFPYRLLLPRNYSPENESYPLVLFLHGQGDDVTDPLKAPPVVDTYLNSPDFRTRHPAIVIAPQCVGSTQPLVCAWGGAQPYERIGEKSSMEILKEVVSRYSVDTSRVYVTGISLGGNGVWDMIWRYPHVFAAALPVSGATWYWKTTHAKDLLTMPIWAAHGELDTEVPNSYDRDFFAAVKALGGTKMRYSEYPGKSHDVWDDVFPDPKYFDWLFSQRLSNPFASALNARSRSLGVRTPMRGRQVTTCGTVTGVTPWDYCITQTVGSRNHDVVYLLHGAQENAHAWVEQKFGSDISAQWAHDHADAPTVVTISFGRFWLLVPKNAAPMSGLADYFVAQVIPHVEKVLLKGPVNQRKLFGLSMGGSNATTLMLARPDLFSSVALACPALVRLSPYADDLSINAYIARSRGGRPDAIREIIRQNAPYYSDIATWDTQSPLPLARKQMNRNFPRLYVSCGDSDEFGLFEGAMDLVATAQYAGVKTQWVPLSGGHCVMDTTSIARFLIAQ